MTGTLVNADAALIVSLATLILTALISVRTMQRAANQDRVEALETELEVVNRRLTDCETHRQTLQTQVRQMGEREVQLMRMLVQRGGEA